MAEKTSKKRQKDKAKFAFLLCMLGTVAVFIFGILLGKNSQNALHQAETIVQPAETEPTTEETVQDTVPAAHTAEISPAVRQATSFWSVQPHIYIRVNHQKPIQIESEPGTDLSGVHYTVSDPGLLLVSEDGNMTGVSKGDCYVTVTCGEEFLQIPVTVREMIVQDGRTYIDGILFVNKEIGLPEDYDPGIQPEAQEAFEEMCSDAKAEGMDIYESSGYRDYQYQINCYDSLVSAYGKEYADHISARPGHSEHQSGYTFDVNTINNDFAETPSGKWLAEHCHEYGFIVRYPQGKETITGYDYESWHIRYVGVEAASEIYVQGLTLEEYLDVDYFEDQVPAEETAPLAENTETQTEIPTETQTETIPVPVQDNGAEFMDAPLEAP